MRITTILILFHLLVSCYPMKRVTPQFSGVFVSKQRGYHEKIKFKKKGIYFFKGKFLYNERTIRKFKIKQPYRWEDNTHTSVLLGLYRNSYDTLHIINKDTIQLFNFNVMHRANFFERISPFFIKTSSLLDGRSLSKHRLIGLNN